MTVAKGKIVKNYIYNTAYQILLVIVPLITSPYLSRTLGATSLGAFNYTHSIVTYFVLFGTFGTSLFAQREIAYYQEDAQKRSKTFYEMLVLRVVAISIVMLGYIAFATFSKEYKILYFILALELIANMFDITWFFQGMEDFKKITIRNAAFKLLGVVAIFIFVKTSADVYKYALCFSLPVLVGNVSLWVYLPKYLVKTKICLKSILGYIKPVAALFLPQIAIEVYTVLDKTMIGSISSNIDNVAFYTYSQNIVKTVLQLITSLGVVMLPAMTSAFAKGNKEEIDSMIKKSVQFIFMLGAPMMFGLAACANTLVLWFYGEDFAAVGPLMMVIAPIIMAIGLSTVIGKQFLLPAKRQKAFTLSVVGGAATNFVLNAILIKHFDAVGASVATVIAELAVVVIQIAYVRKELPMLRYIKQNLKYLLFAAVMFAAIFPISFFVDGVLCTAIQVVGGTTVYGLLLLLTRDKEALALVQKLKEKSTHRA